MGWSDTIGEVLGTVRETANTLNTVNQRGVSSGVVDVVPYQNAVFNNVIVPVSNVVNGPDAASITYQDLEAMLMVLLDARHEWETFVHSYPWPSVKAAFRAQAGFNTLAPYWDDYEQRIRRLMATASTVDWNGGENPAQTGPVNYPGQTSTPTKPTTANTHSLFQDPAVLIGGGLLLLKLLKVF